jgi:hypothetical protein
MRRSAWRLASRSERQRSFLADPDVLFDQEATQQHLGYTVRETSSGTVPGRGATRLSAHATCPRTSGSSSLSAAASAGMLQLPSATATLRCVDLAVGRSRKASHVAPSPRANLSSGRFSE